jgi:DNA-binding NtrC family response regulator
MSDSTAQLKTATDNPIRVLVVDDEQLVRDMLVSYLHTLGFVIDTAEDGLDGLHKYRDGDFDLVITDLSMPNMNGIDLVRQIKEFDDEAVILMITGYPTIGTAVEAIKHGATDYITKPFTLDEVKIRIDKAIGAKTLKGRLKSVQGLAWGLLFSIPLWLVIGIVLALIFR